MGTMKDASITVQQSLGCADIGVSVLVDFGQRSEKEDPNNGISPK